ncbi:MAG TPA: rRNA maturation RNase YbeY [Verrucomicrobiae bacterium]|nr:rRNA maturation RNase YbeY [Verrucomicrobiae bacterium]
MNLRLLQEIALALARELFPNQSRELGVYFVGCKKMAELNTRFVGHEGPTDVITFDYSDGKKVHGEIFICPDVASAQAKEFGTTPQMELVRYLVHGLLHLRGYDDQTEAKRAKMKRAEEKWVRWAAATFPCEKIWSRKRAG